MISFFPKQKRKKEFIIETKVYDTIEIGTYFLSYRMFLGEHTKKERKIYNLEDQSGV